MPRGHSLSIGNMLFHSIFLGKRRSLLHPNTAKQSFFPLQPYSSNILRKNALKGAHKYYTKCAHDSCTLGIP